MSQNQSDLISEHAPTDEELAPMLESLSRDMPKFSEFVNIDAICKAMLSKMKPIMVMDDPPEAKHHFFLCELCSRVFEYVERRG